MSCRTSTWPEHSRLAPMPIVGIVSWPVTSAASACGMASRTIRPGARFLLCEGVGEQPGGSGIIPTLNPVAAELVHRLRRQPDVRADRDATRSGSGSFRPCRRRLRV
jgi:hypothetical protein